MTLTFYDDGGRRLDLSPQGKSGGEGTVLAAGTRRKTTSREWARFAGTKIIRNAKSETT
jgi:hypothetical protein